MTPYSNPSESALLSAYQTYQESMRHFLALQESVMGQFLQAMKSTDGRVPAPNTVSYSLTSITAPPVPAPVPTSPPPIPPTVSQTNGNGNGNGYSNGHSSGHSQGQNGHSNGHPLAAQASTATLAPPAPLPIMVPPVTPAAPPASAVPAASVPMAPPVSPASAAPASASPAPFAAPAPEAETALPDEAALTEMLVTLVSDRTGYPPDMLDLHQDMEAELGIDSIKRVEIFGAFRKQLPSVLADTLQANIEQFTQVKTLAGLVSALLEAAPTAGAPPGNSATATAEVPSLGKPEGAVEDLPCYIMQPRQKSLPAPTAASTALRGLVLLVATAEHDLTRSVMTQLQQAGAVPQLISPDKLADPTQLANSIEHYRQRSGAVRAIVYLTGAVPASPAVSLASSLAGSLPANLAAWREQTRQQSKGLFYLLQACSQDLQTQQGQVIAVSALGGQFGRNGRCGPGSPCAGSSSGLLKTLMIEWPQVRAAAIDVDLDSESEPAVVAAQLVQELQAGCPDAEVGYSASADASSDASLGQGQRTVFEPVQVMRTPPAGGESAGGGRMGVVPAPDWVMLAIGGARGITAEVLNGLIVPGITLVLVGRSPLPDVESAETTALTHSAQLRHWLVQQARSAGQKVTPAQIEKQLRKIQRDRAIRTNLAALQQAGATVDYRALDVRDEAAMAGLMASIYQQYGRLDGVLQGAGIIEDKRLVDKQPASFERVFDTKADSTFLLARYLRPESLKLMLLFASVAGRTGNQGQADYAAANEVVNRLAWWMQQQWPQTRVLSVNWGPWAITGMASDEVNRQFIARGVIPIPPDAGRQYVVNELRWGDRATVEVVAGLFNTPPAEAMTGVASDAVVESRILPLITQPPQLQSTGAVTLTQTFTLGNNPYLKDHCLDGKPVLAAAAAQEWLAQFVQAAWPDWVVCEVRNLRVLGGIVLKTEAGIATQLTAKASTHASSEALEVAAEIKEGDKDRSLYRATLVLRPQFEPAPIISWPPLTEGQTVDVEAAYASYCFHGPLFQLITQIDSLSAGHPQGSHPQGSHPQGADAQVQASSPAVWLNRPMEKRGWLFDPGLVDASLQLGLIFARMQGDTSALPSCFGRVVRYRAIAPLEQLRVSLRIKTFTADQLIYDAAFVDADEQICLLLTDMEGSCSKALNRLRRSHPS